MTTTITVHVSGHPRVFNRHRLQIAYLLRLDHPDDARAVLDALETGFGIEHFEALRLTLGAAACVTNNIEP